MTKINNLLGETGKILMNILKFLKKTKEDTNILEIKINSLNNALSLTKTQITTLHENFNDLINKLHLIIDVINEDLGLRLSQLSIG